MILYYDNIILYYIYYIYKYMKFIHFGCWNNGNCSSDGANGLSLTMKKLNSYIEEKTETLDEIEFIVIAGDNYYPPKGETKKFIEDDFISGFTPLKI